MYSFLIIAAVVGLDQLLKYQVIDKVMLKTNIEVIKNFFYITYVENHGIAFGLFKNKNSFFVITTTIIILALLYTIYRFYSKKILFTVCLALIVGGAIGNLIDRLRHGYVIDYLHFTIFPPVFNLADAAIVCGAVLLSLILFFDKSISI
ncbi:MAG: signal peptidase II [Clostridiales bacterium]|nr:signal peptidase II [Clostridiales bacterium]